MTPVSQLSKEKKKYWAIDYSMRVFTLVHVTELLVLK